MPLIIASNTYTIYSEYDRGGLLVNRNQVRKLLEKISYSSLAAEISESEKNGRKASGNSSGHK
jgi:hypothetical protein